MTFLEAVKALRELFPRQHQSIEVEHVWHVHGAPTLEFRAYVAGVGWSEKFDSLEGVLSWARAATTTYKRPPATGGAIEALGEIKAAGDVAHVSAAEAKLP